MWQEYCNFRCKSGPSFPEKKEGVKWQKQHLLTYHSFLHHLIHLLAYKRFCVCFLFILFQVNVYSILPHRKSNTQFPNRESVKCNQWQLSVQLCNREWTKMTTDHWCVSNFLQHIINGRCVKLHGYWFIWWLEGYGFKAWWCYVSWTKAAWLPVASLWLHPRVHWELLDLLTDFAHTVNIDQLIFLVNIIFWEYFM